MADSRVIPAARISDEDWDLVVRHSPLGQFWHLASWRRYSLAFAGAGAADHSFGIEEDGQLHAVCPLIWEGETLTMGGEPGPMPAAWSQSALVAALQEARATAREYGTRVVFRMPPQKHLPDEVRERIEADGWGPGGWQTRIISLMTARENIWSGVRKSYHALINRAERTHRIVTSFRDALTSEYTGLHKETVGTVLPRPDETYAAQAGWLREGRALLVAAQDRQSGAWDACAYLFLFRDLVYYGSGPARVRTGAMHAVIWAAICESQARGFRNFEMGWQGHAIDAKGKGIEWFKTGFGGIDVPLHTWSRDSS